MTEARLPRTGTIAFGGDYNPEQWPPEVWDADYAAFDAARITTVTLGVFLWSVSQPGPDRYDFTVLDRIVQRAEDEGRQICLATGTGALPPWLAHDHPEVTRVDFEGRKHRYGQRHNACWSSPVFRRLARELAGRVAERYADRPAVVAWHIGNEYGGDGGTCYCELCAGEFRAWLRRRYGTLDALNDAWNTTFWSHRFTAWEQIEPPSALTEHWRGPDHTAFQGITLDYRRFSTDNAIRQFCEEKAAIRAHSDLPVTTNFMGFYQPLDYHRWAPHLDFASWDNYPPRSDEPWRTALTHDLMRGLKDGAPFWLMEQTPTVTASRDVNPVRRPGIMRLWSWQAIAHGSDSVLFFQLRASRGACEMTHGAVLDHSGRLDTRAFREVAGLGAELQRVGDLLLGARTPARAALLVDWDSWWAMELADGPNRLLRYLPTVLEWGRAFWEAGAQLDVLPVTADLSGYDVVAAPLLHLIKDDLPDRLAAVAARGGTVLTGFLSGRVDEYDRRFLADVPGPLAALAGVRVAETDAAEPELANPVTFTDGGPVADARWVFEILVPEGAEVIARYGADFYAGEPAVTRRRVPAPQAGPGGEGQVWYVGAPLDQEGLAHIVRSALGRHDLLGPFAEVPGLELATRITPRGDRIDLVLHHGTAPVTVAAHADGVDLLTDRRWTRGEAVTLAPADVVVLRRD
ncbi:beta-galactosidase [Cellulomonas denverensis]|uniref:Beta-galactosidase n=1 Tax=Cellulomonas denverensis TaxID=264297 RepID=A0A7X6R0F2_9CELL|nr:beta-galactosidase [Cellulomonas denverensis]NKY24249.1 beta-galactosidase [Cellulomonas denverensis]GIG26724.1 beta-galactosidase [Cellulomonas denverensis]